MISEIIYQSTQLTVQRINGVRYVVRPLYRNDKNHREPRYAGLTGYALVGVLGAIEIDGERRCYAETLEEFRTKWVESRERIENITEEDTTDVR